MNYVPTSKFICANPPVPQSVALLGNKILVDLGKMRLSQNMNPQSNMSDVSINGRIWAHMHTGRPPCEDKAAIGVLL